MTYSARITMAKLLQDLLVFGFDLDDFLAPAQPLHDPHRRPADPQSVANQTHDGDVRSAVARWCLNPDLQRLRSYPPDLLPP
jgi:hypothetical protein